MLKIVFRNPIREPHKTDAAFSFNSFPPAFCLALMTFTSISLETVF